MNLNRIKIGNKSKTMMTGTKLRSLEINFKITVIANIGYHSSDYSVKMKRKNMFIEIKYFDRLTKIPSIDGFFLF